MRLLLVHSTMLPSGTARAACLAMVALPASHGTHPQPYSSSSSEVAGCAFCGGHVHVSPMLRSGRGMSTSGRSSVANSCPSSCSPLFEGYGGSSSSTCRGTLGLFVAAARRWGGDDGEDGTGSGDDGRRSGGRRPLRAPWEDIQWSNSDGNSDRRRASRERAGWEEDEDGKEEMFELGGLGERQGRVQRRVYG